MILCSDCDKCRYDRCRFKMPHPGEKVECDMCHKEYKYFIWADGSDRFLCWPCVYKRPAAYLDNIDAVDLDAEQELISKEIEAKQVQEYGPREGYKKLK